MFRSISLLCFLIVNNLAFSDINYLDAFNSFVNEHGKSYSHNEYRYRFSVFSENLRKINQFNSQRRSFTVGMNEFGDLTQSEFRNYFLGMDINIPESDLEIDNGYGYDYGNDSDNGNSYSKRTNFDWRNYDVVTHVKYQIDCASCWAFSAVGAVESCQAIKTSDLINYSEQQLIDCTTELGNHGCSGGSIEDSYEFIYGSGICTNASYPFVGQDQRCLTSCSPEGSMTGYVSVRPGNETDLLGKLNDGPVSAVIDASLWSFQFYTSGIYYDTECSSSAINHGVLVIGYGYDTSDYWLVKNSFGTNWGDGGYIYMTRNSDNNCGIASSATLPTC